MFGIFDGHGGKQVAKFLTQKLPEIFLQKLEKSPEVSISNFENLLKKTFQRLDTSVLIEFKGDSASQGSTADVLIIYEHKFVISAHCGDGKICFYNQNYDQIHTTTDHKPGTPSEKARILQNGGKVLTFFGVSRISTREIPVGLSVCRGFGDFQYKQISDLDPKSLVICDPDIYSIDLSKSGSETDQDSSLESTPDQKNKLTGIMLSCDGVTDRLKDAEIRKIFKETAGSSGCLVRESYFLVSKDNISCLCINFK